MKTIVVLGSGLAGYTLVRELRKLDRDIAIIVVSRDSGDFYSKPMLSNAFAQGKDAAAQVSSAAAEMSRQLDFSLQKYIEVLGIDRQRRQLKTSGGVIEYDDLVLALGADLIRLPLQGGAADAVLSVNDLADYARFLGALGSLKKKVKRVAILRGGLIGCEFANDLASAGYAVTVIDPAAYPLSGLMPEEAGKLLLEPLAKLGVTWRFGVAVKAVDKQASGYALTLTDESALHADVVLSEVGLRPRIELARAAGIVVNRGIVVDAQLRSSDAAIYALGDCAEIEGRVLPYVLPIMHAARALAHVLAGEDARVEFPAMPIVIKTPAYPVVVLPVARDAIGEWKTMAQGEGIKQAFFDAKNQLCGFALTGVYAGERSEMVKQVTIN
ncbi:MAG: FAD-dependent oxidoreductase [Gallionella sp.]|nr:FAD-dependent oxidoreductase [Gallionella sp.]